MKNLCPLLLLGAALLSFAPRQAAAQEPTAPAAPKAAPIAPKVAQDTFEVMIGALEDDNRDAFVAFADERFKTALTPIVFKAVSDQVAARLRTGHEDLYLGSMKKAGFIVHIWRLSFADGGDEMLAQLSLKDDRVGGFFLN